MTPTELFNAYSRAYGGKEVAIPPSEIADKMRRSPPSTTPAAPRVDPVQQFDAEMRAAGIQQQPSREPLPVANGRDGYDLARNGVRVPNGQSIDPAAIERINTDFRQEFGRLQAELSSTGSDAAKGRIQQQMRELSQNHQAKLAAVMPGAPDPTAREQKLSQLEHAEWSKPVEGQNHRELTEAGEALRAEVLAEFKALPEAQQKDPETRDVYTVALLNLRADDNARVAVEHFHPSTLHGYTLPKLLPQMRYPATVIHDLARARAAGFTQEQVTAYIKADLVKNGWLKA